MVRYFKKLNTEQGWYEEVDDYTYKNADSALNDAGDTHRYLTGGVVLNEDYTINVTLHSIPTRDLAILARALQASEPAKVEGGFVREMPTILFKTRHGKTIMRRQDGSIWEQKRSA